MSGKGCSWEGILVDVGAAAQRVDVERRAAAGPSEGTAVADGRTRDFPQEARIPSFEAWCSSAWGQ